MDFMSKRFFVLLLALGAGVERPCHGEGSESASRSPAPAAREGAEFTRLP